MRQPNSYLVMAETVDKIIRRARRYKIIKRWNTLMFLERELKWQLKFVRKEYHPLRKQVEDEINKMTKTKR
jgi:hypothetical protein